MKTLTTFCAATAVAGGIALVIARPLPAAPAQETFTSRQVAAAEGEATDYAIDATHSMALFRVQHLGAGAFWGRFNTLSGMIQHDPDAAAGLRIDLSIDIASVDTGNDNLDGHLKSPDFFNAAEFPATTFKSSTARMVGKRNYEVTGDLTMHGVTKRITANVEWVGTKAGARGERCGFEATITVKRSDFGMDYGIENGALGDETRIVVALEAVKQEKDAAQTRQRTRGAGREGGLMGRFDANGDGKIERSELPERMRDRFDVLDADGDGTLSAEELKVLRGGGPPR